MASTNGQYGTHNAHLKNIVSNEASLDALAQSVKKAVQYNQNNVTIIIYGRENSF